MVRELRLQGRPARIHPASPIRKWPRRRPLSRTMRPAPARLARSFVVRYFVVRSGPAPARAVSSRKPSSRHPSSHNRGRAFSLRKRGIRRKRIFAHGAWPLGREWALAPVPAPNLRTARSEGLQAQRERLSARREGLGARRERPAARQKELLARRIP